ncbi:MAG: YihY/virulence factor BrkB family protein [Bacteroidetes bacterium]|nr:YihY/virulence factor BrkB family protein [Bacteroidota bacterium]
MVGDFRGLYRKLCHISFPGFQEIPIATVMANLARSLEKEDINMRAAAMSYNFFLALFPAVIFFFTLIAFIPIEDLHFTIMQKISELMPKSAFESTESTITDILKNQRGGLLSFGFFSAMLFSSNAVFNMFSAFNKYDQTVESRSVIYRRLLSLLLTIFLSAFIIISVLLVTFGQTAIDFLVQKRWLTDGISYYGLILLKWGATIFIFYTVISCLYFFGSSLKRHFKLISTGTTVATIGSIITTVGFAAYVNNFNSYNKLYGSIGTLLVVMILIYFNSLMILYGYELNSSIEKAVRDKIKLQTMSVEDLENNQF